MVLRDRFDFPRVAMHFHVHGFPRSRPWLRGRPEKTRFFRSSEIMCQQDTPLGNRQRENPRIRQPLKPQLAQMERVVPAPAKPGCEPRIHAGIDEEPERSLRACGSARP